MLRAGGSESARGLHNKVSSFSVRVSKTFGSSRSGRLSAKIVH